MKRKTSKAKTTKRTVKTAKHVRQMTTAELQAVSQAMKAKSEKTAKKAAKPNLSPEQAKQVARDERKARAEIAKQEFAAAVISAFAANGYKNVVARKTVRTARLWLDAGMKPKASERPIIVPAPWSPPGGGYALYHISQCEKA